HGLFQIQGFEMAFVTGFLMTALPRFMEVPSARPWELFLGVAFLILGVAALYQERWVLAEVGFLAQVVHLCIFALRRFGKRQDTPPPTFLLVPIGLLHALLGGLLILYPLPGFVKLGQRMVEQGMLLSFVLAIGPYLGPRLLGTIQTKDRSGHPVAHLVTGVLLFASFWIESGFSPRWGLLLRAGVVTFTLVRTARIHRLPASPLWHLRFLWLSFWCLPGGLWLAGLFPDYDILSLHLTFIGGFSLITFTIASRVIAAHTGFESLWQKNTKTLRFLGGSLVLAALARMASDFYPNYYFGMLHLAAGIWLTGAVIWAVVFLPKVLPWHVTPDED
ncbi:MAG: NnrS family protein, partial [bacterium]|nr:NnrS family protein [bacterium]